MISSARVFVLQGTPLLDQLIAAELLQDCADHLAQLRRRLAHQRSVLKVALAEALPDWTPNRPAGGSRSGSLCPPASRPAFSSNENRSSGSGSPPAPPSPSPPRTTDACVCPSCCRPPNCRQRSASSPTLPQSAPDRSADVRPKGSSFRACPARAGRAIFSYEVSKRSSTRRLDSSRSCVTCSGRWRDLPAVCGGGSGGAVSAGAGRTGAAGLERGRCRRWPGRPGGAVRAGQPRR